MPIYTESGLQVILPDGESFRFQDCSIYKQLKGSYLREMDFGWWDSTKNILWLLELKDYSHLQPTDKLPDRLLDILIEKATDSLLILSAVWIGSLNGQGMKSDLPTACHIFPTEPKKLKIVFVMKLTNHHIKVELSPLKTRLLERLKGRTTLFDMKIGDVTLVDHLNAMKYLPIINLSTPNTI